MPGVNDFGLRAEPLDAGTHMVAPSGEIDAYTAPQLGSCLLELAEEGEKDVVVDLSRVTFMDSTGIGVLLNGVRALASRRRQLVVVCPTERMLRPFQVTGLIDRLSITGSREEALGRLATV